MVTLGSFIYLISGSSAILKMSMEYVSYFIDENKFRVIDSLPLVTKASTLQ